MHALQNDRVLAFTAWVSKNCGSIVFELYRDVWRARLSLHDVFPRLLKKRVNAEPDAVAGLQVYVPAFQDSGIVELEAAFRQEFHFNSAQCVGDVRGRIVRHDEIALPLPGA